LRALAGDGVLPPWSSWFREDSLCETVPDEPLRATLVEEMPRLPLSYFEASVPLPRGWNASPALISYSPDPYGDTAARGAPAAGRWPRRAGVRHPGMANEPIAATNALLGLERARVGSG
jgi:hypothetical protein